MSLITFFINRILEKEKKEKNMILSYQCLNTIDNLDNDVKSYYYLQCNFECGMVDLSSNLLDYYLMAKKISNGFIRLVRYFKWKKANKYSWDSDLYMINNLDDLPSHQVISLLINTTIYRFKISDIINIWNQSLLHRMGLFAEPEFPKNPHTNQPFKLHNLYNIYFGIYRTFYNMPLTINAFFNENFNLARFKVKYLPLLREKIINVYYKEATSYEIYEYLLTMLDKLKDEIGNVYIPTYPTLVQETNILKKMKHFVLLYLRSTLSCNPLIRNKNNSELTRKLKIFIDDDANSDIIYIYRSLRTAPVYSSSYQQRYSYSENTPMQTEPPEPIASPRRTTAMQAEPPEPIASPRRTTAMQVEPPTRLASPRRTTAMQVEPPTRLASPRRTTVSAPNITTDTPRTISIPSISSLSASTRVAQPSISSLTSVANNYSSRRNSFIYNTSLPPLTSSTPSIRAPILNRSLLAPPPTTNLSHRNTISSSTQMPNRFLRSIPTIITDNQDDVFTPSRELVRTPENSRRDNIVNTYSNTELTGNLRNRLTFNR